METHIATQFAQYAEAAFRKAATATDEAQRKASVDLAREWQQMSVDACLLDCGVQSRDRYDRSVRAAA